MECHIFEHGVQLIHYNVLSKYSWISLISFFKQRIVSRCLILAFQWSLPSLPVSCRRQIHSLCSSPSTIWQVFYSVAVRTRICKRKRKLHNLSYIRYRRNLNKSKYSGTLTFSKIAIYVHIFKNDISTWDQALIRVQCLFFGMAEPVLSELEKNAFLLILWLISSINYVY